MGIPRNRLYTWQTEVRARGGSAFPGGGRKEGTSEIARLKRELARVTEERDILIQREVPACKGGGVSKVPRLPVDSHA